MAVIPHDVAMLEALSKYKAYPSFKKKSKGSEEFKKLASTLIGERPDSSKLKKFFKWINPKKQDINRTIYYEEVFK
jgi:hypothetical protein